MPPIARFKTALDRQTRQPVATTPAGVEEEPLLPKCIADASRTRTTVAAMAGGIDASSTAYLLSLITSTAGYPGRGCGGGGVCGATDPGGLSERESQRA